MTGHTNPVFLGYRRQIGRPGIRNYLLILNLTGLTAPSARHIAAQLMGSRLVSMPHGLAVTGRGEAPVTQTLEGFARHPNAGGVLVLSADRKKAMTLLARLSDDGRPIEAVTLDSVHRDALGFRTAALRAGAQILSQISRQKRERCDWSELAVALQCGMSDPTSGLFANPLLGAVTDRLVADGGAAVFGETTEWLGCEEALEARATTPALGRRIRAAVTGREDRARVSGHSLLGNNPNEANIAAGLTTIEDKAIGSISKSGRGPIAAILDYGDQLGQSGLAAMDGPSYSPESLSGLVASGAQIALFTSGVGNSYVSRMAPTLKITANGATADALPEQFDFTCAETVEAPERMAESVDALIARMMEVASGALTFGEILGEDDEVIARFGETL